MEICASVLHIFLSPDNSHLNILHLLFTCYFLLKTLSLKTTMLTNENVMTLLTFTVRPLRNEGEPLHPSLNASAPALESLQRPLLLFLALHFLDSDFMVSIYLLYKPSTGLALQKISPQLAFPLSFLPSRFGNATEKVIR